MIQRPNCQRGWVLKLTVWLAIAVGVVRAPAQEPVTLVGDGLAPLPIVAPGHAGAADELERYLERISGADFVRADAAQPGGGAIYLGLFADFPALDQDAARALGSEGFILRSNAATRSLYLVANGPAGLRHAVATFLHHLGCRWFFPGSTWEVIPSRKTIRGSWDERGAPSFRTQRKIWYGFGAYGPEKEALEAWEGHNRMGGPVAVQIGHTWHGIEPERDFAAHPEWFALLDGRRQATKPCYSHPEVTARAIGSALQQAERGSTMISMSPPDGLGYCECERCRAVFQGAEPVREHGTLFAQRPDGRTVNITSETLFAFVNRVATAVAEKYPQVQIGCYAYSAYSHPPSFKLHPNVYLQTTTSFRRTPLGLKQQIEEFGALTSQVGIRDYYSVFQFDWDFPDPGKVTPRQLQADLRFYRSHGVTAINAEASCNWAPRGLSYYVAAQLMWDVDADVAALVRDFYDKAFGPAAAPMQRYYVRWYGDEVAALPAAGELPQKGHLVAAGAIDVAVLAAAYQDLDAASKLVSGSPDHRARVDQLRLYLHYLVLRWQLGEAERGGDQQAVLDAIRAETIFGGRLTRSGMIHARALVGKAFPRRFSKHAAILEKVPDASQSGAGWRQVGEPPTREELQQLWEADRALLDAH